MRRETPPWHAVHYHTGTAASGAPDALAGGYEQGYTDGRTDGWHAAHYALQSWRPGAHDGACECAECVTVRAVIDAVLRYTPEETE